MTGPRSFLPSWDMIGTKLLELRKRRGLMIAALVLIPGVPVLVLGLRLLFHAVDPASYGPAGTPSIFQALCNVMAEFGFIIAATIGASAGTTDLTEGVFRHLVVTGRSRLALFFARIPAGLAVVMSLVAVSFLMICLATSYESPPQPSSFAVNGYSVPVGLSSAGLESWIEQHRGEAVQAFFDDLAGTRVGTPAELSAAMPAIYADYTSFEYSAVGPPPNEMAKIGLWIALDVGLGFVVGLGLGALTGQRTVSVILLIGLEIIVTPILTNAVIPYFIDGQRLVIGVAMAQLRPAALASAQAGGGRGPGRVLLGGRTSLGIPPMPTWAMIAVIVGWVVVWTAIGAWRMSTRDA